MNKKILRIFYWIFLFLYLGLIIWSVYYALINPADRYKHLSVGWKFLVNSTFWTFQSNVANFIFLFIVLLSLYIKKIKISYNWFIIMSSYMFITMCLFWMALAGISFSNKDIYSIPYMYQNNYNNPSIWVITTGLHFISLIFLWVVHGFIMKKENVLINYKNWNLKWLPYSIIFPLFYLVYVLIMGEIGMSVHEEFVGPQGQVYTKSMQSFPYFFCDLGVKFGFETFLGASGGVLLTSFGAQYLIIAINNKVVKKDNEKTSFSIKKDNANYFVINIIEIIFYVILLGLILYKFGSEKGVKIYDHAAVFTYIYFVQLTELIFFTICQLICIILKIAKKDNINSDTMYTISAIVLFVTLWNIYFMSILVLLFYATRKIIYNLKK